MRPSISVLLPAFREPLSYVKASVASIRKQTFTNFECLLILDDPANAVLKKYFTSVCRQDKRFILIINEENVGLAEALNRGIRQSQGQYLARHDADDICLPDRFMKQMRFMKAHPATDLLFTGVHYIDEKGAITGTFIPNPKHAITIRKHIFNDVLLVHPTLLAKAELLRKHQYDPSFRRSQDTELWLRLVGTARFAILPEVCLLYRLGKKEDINNRIRKVVTWSTAARKAFIKHRAKYLWTPAYWRRLLTFDAIILAGKLPSSWVIQAVRLKDKATSRSKA